MALNVKVHTLDINMDCHLTQSHLYMQLEADTILNIQSVANVLKYELAKGK